MSISYHPREQTVHHLVTAADGGTVAIDERLNALDAEWSSGRASKATAVALIAAALGLPGDDRLRRLFAILGGGLLAHALLTRRGILDSIFEQVGFRSHKAIECERVALRALRGDFRALPTLHDVENPEEISRFEGEGGAVLETEERKLDPHNVAHELLTTAHA